MQPYPQREVASDGVNDASIGEGGGSGRPVRAEGPPWSGSAEGSQNCKSVINQHVDEAVIELCPGTDMELHLPLSADFAAGNLSPDDIDEQIHTTEVKS